ncbi:MAG: hypothetical protein HY402_06940 [Elusimicrobia bacterium]|nr:hypothetical protein [Elusimicrobiota bacterium]
MRKRFFVENVFLLQSAFFVTLLAAAALAVAYLAADRALQELEARAVPLGVVTVREARSALSGPFFWSGLVAVAGAFLLSIYWFHRAAGPMQAILSALDRMLAGNFVEPIRLRRGDYWRLLAEKLNSLQERFKGRR